MAPPEQSRDTEEFAELPVPTQWPMVAALGITLGFAGLVTHFMVTIVGGVLVVAGFVGWFREVLPAEHLERVPLRPPSQRARPVQPAPQKVAHLVAGEAGHRVRIPAEIHPYSAGVWGGLAGGAAMAALALLYGLIAYGSIWYPINLLAAVAMPALGSATTAQLAAFNGTALGVATVAHLLVSVFVGLVYAASLPMLPRRPVLWGGVAAPLLWTGLLWATLRVINPVLNQRIDWRWFIASQIAFGLAAGYVISRSGRIETMQTWPLAARAGIEAPGISAEREEDE
jgi:hypothetical protein